ncbi:MAG: hypothetical protein ACLR0U_07985 [Enterocloster clostridioformis]
MVTSPILSNIYMDFFDERFHDNYPGLIYTRYSDDMQFHLENGLTINLF